jgi:hypothetical protein
LRGLSEEEKEGRRCCGEPGAPAPGSHRSTLEVKKVNVVGEREKKAVMLWNN